MWILMNKVLYVSWKYNIRHKEEGTPGSLNPHIWKVGTEPESKHSEHQAAFTSSCNKSQATDLPSTNASKTQGKKCKKLHLALS